MQILYRDAHLAVVDKPAGLMVHASPMARGETEFALDRIRALLDAPRAALAHRLDRATSGCLLLGLERDVTAALGRAFMSREVDKRYLAVCRGWPDEAFTVDHALDGGPGKPEKKPAVTHFRRLAIAELDEPSPPHATSRYALLECRPDTGRWRQIRRHLKHVSHHLIGDTSHGDGRHNRTFRRRGVHRMLLHAWRLSFAHPVDGRAVAVAAPLDDELHRALTLLGWSAPG